ncbi:MAG: DUF1071 domain-containing protein, partial [Comamonadaceae bacterium]
ARLYAVDVSKNIERKGNFSYLSWPYAVAQLRLADPTANWEVRRFDGLPYLACEAGVFVEVAVTVQGITLSQIHPVLDARNKPLLAPTVFDINTSVMRALVKAIALHGLGLYIYAGEDLPQPASDAANDPAPEPKPEPRTDITRHGPTINAKQQVAIQKLVMEVGMDMNKLLAHFGVRQLRDLPTAEYMRVVRSLEKRRA